MVKITLTQRKRAAILQAAIDAFQARGAQSTSMDTIAELAQVSKRTVYNHFASKERLLEEVFSLWLHQCFDVAIAPFDPMLPLEQQLLEIARCKFDLLNDPAHIALSRLVIGESLHSPLMAKEQMMKLLHSEDKLVKWLEAASAQGVLKPLDALSAAHQFWSLIKAFAFWPQVIGHAPPLDRSAQEKVSRDAVDILLSYYTKP